VNAKRKSLHIEPCQDLIEISTCIVVVDFLLKVYGWNTLLDVPTVLKISHPQSKASAYVVLKNLSSMVRLMQEIGWDGNGQVN
jgi:hypothetical protein